MLSNCLIIFATLLCLFIMRLLSENSALQKMKEVNEALKTIQTEELSDNTEALDKISKDLEELLK